MLARRERDRRCGARASGDRAFKMSGLSGPQIHVDADKISELRRMCHDAFEQCLAMRFAKIEAELRQLQRDVGIDFLARNSVEDREVTFRGAPRSRLVRYVFTKQIEAGQASATIHIGPTGLLGVGVESASQAASSGISAGLRPWTRRR